MSSNPPLSETKGEESHPTRMLFLYRGWNSGTNQALFHAWREGTPDLDIHSLDVSPLTDLSLVDKLKLLPVALRQNGLALLFQGRGGFADAIKRSRWGLEVMTARLDQFQQQDNFDFALCFGTIIPMRHIRKPYFIYTDLAIRSNLCYPEGEHQVRLWQDYLPDEEETLRRAALVFTMSDHVSRSLVEQYHLPSSKILRVNVGCNAPPCPAPDPNRFNRQNILFIGVDWQRKGGPELFTAFRRVRSRYPRATLTIVGCSPRIAGEGIDIVGPVSQNQIPDFLAQATLFCMPSRREPFGIAYIEAMRAGLPIIASSFGAAPDFVRDDLTGYTVDPADIDLLAKRIEELIADPEKCRRLGLAGRHLVSEEYTWPKTQQRMWAAIRPFLSP